MRNTALPSRLPRLLIIAVLLTLAACCAPADHCIPDGYHGYWYDYTSRPT